MLHSYFVATTYGNALEMTAPVDPDAHTFVVVCSLLGGMLGGRLARGERVQSFIYLGENT